MLFKKYFFYVQSSLLSVFATFCWSAFIDLFIGLELDGFVKGFMGFYFVEGEPYLNSSHGTMINYWDGTVHFALQLSGIVLFCMQYVFFFLFLSVYSAACSLSFCHGVNNVLQ